MKLLVVFAFVITPLISISQNCSCEYIIKDVVNKLKENYAGYKDKTEKDSAVLFSKLVDSVLAKSNKNQNDCFLLLQDIIAYFKDPHLGLTQVYDSLLNRQVIKNRQNFIELEKKFLAGKKQNRIEGYWYSTEGSYKVVIIKERGVDIFNAYIVKSNKKAFKKGDLKMRLKAINSNTYKTTYVSSDLSRIFTTSVLRNNELETMFGAIIWTRKSVLSKDNHSSSISSPDLKPSARELDSSFLITIPTFDATYKPFIDSLIALNLSQIRKSKHLIIDIRDNSGGSEYAYKSLLKFICTGPIYSESAFTLCTEINHKKYDELISLYKDNFSTEELKNFSSYLDSMKNNLGSWIFMAGDTMFCNEEYNYPEKVSVIVNRKSASTTELFLLACKQSKKTTIFGESTVGALDYTEPMTHNICNYEIDIPIVKRARNLYPANIDYEGIKPDIIISPKIGDWIRYVQRWK
jgi:hypothetical protein